MNRLREIYNTEVVKKMEEEFGYTNKLQVPRVDKVVINMGVGETLSNPKMLEKIADNLAVITGQRPVPTKAKQSIAGFKIRTGDKVGIMITLRGPKMYDFLDRLVTIVLPRIRDFRGLPNKSFDGKGNYTIGMKEHTVFPEIPYDTVEFIHGFQINISTTAKTDKEARALLVHLGFPFQKES